MLAIPAKSAAQPKNADEDGTGESFSLLNIKTRVDAIAMATIKSTIRAVPTPSIPSL